MNNATEIHKDTPSCHICTKTSTVFKILPCGHLFCLTPCILEIVKRLNPVCPLCRKSIVLPPSREITDLATNSSETGLLEILEEKSEAKRKAEFMETQLAEYRQKLLNLNLSKSVYEKPWRHFKVSSFESLKSTTEALCETSTQQLRTGSLHNLEMQEKLHDIGKNIKVLEEYIRDTRQDNCTILLKKVGITNYTVEPHHLFRVLEAVNVMNFRSDRHSEEIMFKCNELVYKFLASRDLIRKSCNELYKEFPNESLPHVVVEERFVKILEEMEKCKACYEDIYEVIGTNFVSYDQSFAKKCLNTYLSTRNKYDLQITSNDRAQFLRVHLKRLQYYKQITEILCEDLRRYLLEEDFEASAVHEKLKEIEMRLEKTEYHCQLLKSLSCIEERCHKIVEEFEGLHLTKHTMTAQIRGCCEHKEEVTRLWKLILQLRPKTLSFDVNVIEKFSKAMEGRRDKVIALLVLSDSEINEFCRRFSKVKGILEFSARLHGAVKEISDSMPYLNNLYHREKLEDLYLVSEVSYLDPVRRSPCIRKYSLQKLLLFINQGKRLKELFKEIHGKFDAECNFAYQIALSRYEVMYGPFQEYFAIVWKELFHFNQENRNQWKKVADTAKTENFEISALNSQIEESLSLNKRVKAYWLDAVSMHVGIFLFFFFLALFLCTLITI